MKESSGKYNLPPEVDSCLPRFIPHGPPTISFVNAVANGKLRIVIGACYAHHRPSCCVLRRVVSKCSH